MPSTNSPNMGLPIPGVTTQPGPQYATDINQCFGILDGHTHAPGAGVPIGAPGLNIQSDLAFNINNATSMRSVRFVSTTATSGTDIGCIYVRGVDLFYNDLNGNNIGITRNGGLSTTAIFSGLISTTAIISANGGNPATSGFIRMNNNTDFVSWRNAGNNADNKIYFDASDDLQVVGAGDTGVAAFNHKFIDQTNSKVIKMTAPVGSSAYKLSLPQQPAPFNPLFFDGAGGLTSPLGIMSGIFTSNGASSAAVYGGGTLAVTATSTGRYTIAVTPPFSGQPVGLGTTQGSPDGVLSFLSIGQSSCTIATNVIGAQQNISFSIILIGPRA